MNNRSQTHLVKEIDIYGKQRKQKRGGKISLLFPRDKAAKKQTLVETGQENKLSIALDSAADMSKLKKIHFYS
jgi:hypothetical protein